MTFDAARLSHAYITESSFADTLAMTVVCGNRDGERPCKNCTHCKKAKRHIHPDIIVIGKLEEKLIVTVDQIREVKKDVYILPNEAVQKAYIINDADSMNINAQNALLQILEEPPKHDVFILCSENPAALLPT
ncbi:MAG: DNA polymerase III subunit delta, partial [Oscillospiraceae bacterium]|nr:DNA polymerase III subunit delta [Oscillospiraceae bacterium]